MAKFLMLLHEEPGANSGLSAAEMQRMFEAYSAWAAGLAARGALVSGEKLTYDGGRHAARRDGRMIVTDGPFAEAKDLIGGFFIITAADFAEAEALIADCPHLQFGWVELRRIEDLTGAEA